MSLIKLVFQHDKAYGKSKDLTKRTQSDKDLRDKAFKIASDPIYDGYQKGLASMIHKFFDKKSSESGAAASLVNTSATDPNYQPAIELDRQIIKTFKRWKVYSSFRNDIWGADLVYMQPLRK